METPKLVLKIEAKFDWPLPPQNTAEAALQKHASVEANYIAKELETAIVLIIATVLKLKHK